MLVWKSSFLPLDSSCKIYKATAVWLVGYSGYWFSVFSVLKTDLNRVWHTHIEILRLFILTAIILKVVGEKNWWFWFWSWWRKSRELMQFEEENVLALKGEKSVFPNTETPLSSRPIGTDWEHYYLTLPEVKGYSKMMLNIQNTTATACRLCVVDLERVK